MPKHWNYFSNIKLLSCLKYKLLVHHISAYNNADKFTFPGISEEELSVKGRRNSYTQKKQTLVNKHKILKIKQVKTIISQEKLSTLISDMKRSWKPAYLNFCARACANHCSIDVPVHWQSLNFYNLVHQIAVIATYKFGKLQINKDHPLQLTTMCININHMH